MTAVATKAAASYRARAIQGTWQPQEKILRLVSAEFRVPASTILTRSTAKDTTLARNVWWYLCAVTFPEGAAEARRRCKVTKRGLQLALRRIEDLRDDRTFDERLERLEAAIDAL